MTFGYIGNGAYCYANALAMALAATGADHAPGYLECLTTVGIGALAVPTSDGPLPFFGDQTPDAGVSLTLDTLGYACERHVSTAADDAAGAAATARLRELLAAGPVIAGPLDMGELAYMPGHARAAGADHFVAVYALDGDEVRLHDPAGFPYVALALSAFLAAWRAESIAYRQGSYSLWGALRQIRRPTPDEVFAATDRELARRARDRQRSGQDDRGPGVILRLAERVRDGVPPSLHGHLAHFALPLGARRGADYARFFAPHDPERAGLKEAQARAFGAAFTALRREDWRGLADGLRAVAETEARFEERTVAAALAAA